MTCPVPTKGRLVDLCHEWFRVVFRLTGIGMRCVIICRLVPFEASRNAIATINYSPLIVM